MDDIKGKWQNGCIASISSKKKITNNTARDQTNISSMISSSVMHCTTIQHGHVAKWRYVLILALINFGDYDIKHENINTETATATFVGEIIIIIISSKALHSQTVAVPDECPWNNVTCHIPDPHPMMVLFPFSSFRSWVFAWNWWTGGR